MVDVNFFKRPLVSVVLASYNHAKFIREAVESVLNQDMPDLELLVLDDGSFDGTPDVVDKIKDKRLKLIRLVPNRRYHPRNLGIKKARGKYIAFQNSDDVWMKNKLTKQIDVLEKDRRVVVCFTRLDMINEKGEIIKRSWAKGNLPGNNMNNDGWLRHLFIRGINFGIASALVRRDKIIRLGGFNESMIQMADYDLWVRLLGLGQFFIIEKPLTKMRIVKGVNLSRPHQEVYIRSVIENIDILNRYTQWPVKQYLRFIFPDIMPENNRLINVQYVALARYAWRLNTSHHALFADQLIARLLNDPKASQEILAYFGSDLKKEYIKRRGKLEIKVHK